MSTFERIAYLAVIAMLAVLLLREGCRNGGSGEVAIKTKTVTIIDTIKGKSDSFYIPKLVNSWKHDTTEITEVRTVQKIVQKTDTINVVNDWNEYNDTLHFDSLGYATVHDIVSGKIEKRDFKYSLIRRKDSTIITEQIKRMNFLLGVEIMGNKITPASYLGIGAGIQFKNGSLIKLSAGQNKGEVMYGLSYFKKL